MGLHNVNKASDGYVLDVRVKYSVEYGERRHVVVDAQVSDSYYGKLKRIFCKTFSFFHTH